MISAVALTIWAASMILPAIWEHNASAEFDREAKAPSDARKEARVNEVLGRLSVPRLGLSAMVREGDQESTLTLALGHIPGTALPGEYGNVGVAGHRDRLFRGLRDIQANDEIRFDTLDGSYLYRVEKTEIVQPSDIGVLRAGGRRELTLVTCYPFYYVGSAPERFIVKARQVNAGLSGTLRKVLDSSGAVARH